jgi:PAS domain S-box-containing protein
MDAASDLARGFAPAAEAAPAGGRPSFGTVMSCLEEGVALFDAEDRFVWWNRRYAQLYGLTSAQLRPGLAFSAFVRHGAETGQFLDAVGRVEAWVGERLQRTADGAPRRERLPGERWVRVREHATPDGGRLRTVIDTTGAQRTDSSFRLLFDANPVALSVVDARTLQFLAVNDAAVAKYGYSHEAFLELTMVDLAAPEAKADLKAIMTSKIGGYDGQTVWSHVTARGRRIRIKPYVRPLIYEGRACLLCGAVDVTHAPEA